AAWEERVGEAGLVAQPRHLRLPAPRHERRDEVAVERVADRRLEEALERELPEALGELDPRRDGAGHGDAVPAALRDALLAGEVLRRPRRGRAARGVQAAQLLAVPD